MAASLRRSVAPLLLLFLTSCTHAEKLDLTRLKLPSGFHISEFAQVASARFMAFSPAGTLLVTQTNDGKVVALPDSKHAGHADRTVTVLSDLNAPHGIAFHNGRLYVAETDAVRSYDWEESNLRASNGQLITKLPGSGEHFTRSILFANGKMYVSVGSPCNVCKPDDAPRAAVLEFNENGTGERVFASGLRNAVGLALNPATQTIWTTENGRDWLGDNLPPDEINDLGKNGGNFGWPYCYGDRVRDRSQSADYDCAATIPAKVELQAHSAPLGLAVYEGATFPAEYRGNLLVALHGSWNRGVPTGYKVVRIKLGQSGQVQGPPEDFLTGWLAPGEQKKNVYMGRPVGVSVGPDGALYISDDFAGRIYRVSYSK